MDKYQTKGEILQSQIDDIIASHHLEEDDVDKLTTFILSNFQVVDDSEEEIFDLQDENLILEDSDTDDIAKDVEQITDYQNDELKSTDSVRIYLRDAAKLPLLDTKQELAIAKRIAGGDEEAKNELVSHNLRLVVNNAKISWSRHCFSRLNSRRKLRINEGCREI